MNFLPNEVYQNQRCFSVDLSAGVSNLKFSDLGGKSPNALVTHLFISLYPFVIGTGALINVEFGGVVNSAVTENVLTIYDGSQANNNCWIGVSCSTITISPSAGAVGAITVFYVSI